LNRPPPCPLEEGDKIQVHTKTMPLNEGMAKGSSQPVPLNEGVAKGRGRFPGEIAEPFPLHRMLYNKNLQPTANHLRKRMTKAEACLWKYVLRAGQMKGYIFNRQRPVLRYIADFMCKPLNLIVEVDGSSHDDPQVQKHDAFRQFELEECGFEVLRFTNDQVLHAIDSVRRAIMTKIKEIESSCLHTGRGWEKSSPCPLKEGDRHRAKPQTAYKASSQTIPLNEGMAKGSSQPVPPSTRGWPKALLRLSPFNEGVAEGSSQTVPLKEGVAEGRGRYKKLSAHFPTSTRRSPQRKHP
jgi:very-short-patch-repair endonuclease